MIDKFEAGKWYVYDGKKRMGWWNIEGNMDFILDNKPRLCVNAINSTEDSGVKFDNEDTWYWHKDDMKLFREVPAPEMITKLPEGFVQISEEQASYYASWINDKDDRELAVKRWIANGHIRKSKLDEARDEYKRTLYSLKSPDDNDIIYDIVRVKDHYEAAIAEQKAEIDRLKGK